MFTTRLTDLNPPADVQGTCIKCPTGVVCDDMGITLETLPMAAGYWRVDHESDSFLACKEESACQGTNYTLWKAKMWPLAQEAVTAATSSDAGTSGSGTSLEPVRRTRRAKGRVLTSSISDETLALLDNVCADG